MGMNFFEELNRVNAAYCASRGLAAAELYGTPPNEAEFETSRLIAAGVPSEAATPVFKAHKAKHLKYWPRTPFQRLGYIEAQMQQGCYQGVGK